MIFTQLIFPVEYEAYEKELSKENIVVSIEDTYMEDSTYQQREIFDDKEEREDGKEMHEFKSSFDSRMHYSQESGHVF